MKRVNYVLSKPLIEKVRLTAKKQDVSMSEIIRKALEEFFKNEEIKN